MIRLDDNKIAILKERIERAYRFADHACTATWKARNEARVLREIVKALPQDGLLVPAMLSEVTTIHGDAFDAENASNERRTRLVDLALLLGVNIERRKR